MNKFRAWQKERKEYVHQRFLDQIFLNMDGRVIWYSYSGFEDVTDKFEIEFSVNIKGEEVFEGDITGSRCVVRLGEFGIDDEYIGFYITDSQCKWGLDADLPINIIGNIRENPELLNWNTEVLE